MKISILGTGNMASGLAVLFARAGHAVTLGSGDPARAQAVASQLDHGIAGAGFADAAGKADLVVLAVPYSAVAEVLAVAGDLTSKTVVDITNPMNADFSGLAIGLTTSAAEEIQKLVPGAKVVKAFNTVFAQVLKAGGSVGGQPATVFIAGDDADARATVARLVAETGLVPLAVGGLSSARYLEPVAGLNISLGYGLGLGTDIAPTWLRAA